MVLTRDMTVYRRKGKKGYFENEIKLPSIVYAALHECTSALFLGTPQRVPESDSYLFACALTLLYIGTYCFFCLLKGFLLPRKCLCILTDVALHVMSSWNTSIFFSQSQECVLSYDN